MSEEPSIAAKVLAPVIGHLLHLPEGGEDADEQTAKIVQLAADTVPAVMQGMVENLPEDLKPPVLASYEDGNGEPKWGYFPASEVNKG